MHLQVKQSNRGTAALLAQAQQDYVKARDRVAKVMDFEKWPLVQQILYLLEEADASRICRPELDALLESMKTKHWSVLANPETGVYARAMRFENVNGLGQSVVFEMKQKSEEDPAHHVDVAFTIVRDKTGKKQKTLSVSIEDSESTAIVLRDAPTIEELKAWKEQAESYKQALSQLAMLRAGQLLDEKNTSPLIHEKIHENLTVTVTKKIWFWERSETVTRSFDEAASVVGQIENGYEWTQAKDAAEGNLARWVPLLNARAKQIERDQIASCAFSDIADQLSEQGWRIKTPDSSE